MAIFVEAPKSVPRIIVANHQNLKMVFFGTPQFAVPSLRALVTDHWPLSLVVTAPDKPVGRKAMLTPSPIKQVAQELGIPVATPEKLSVVSDQLSALQPDLGIVVAYGKIIPKEILNMFRLGIINVHPSLLPKYRGPSPIQSAILNGDSETGVSIMLLDEAMDHGPVLAQEPWQIPSGFDAPACEDELSRLGADLLTRTVEKHIRGDIVPRPQDHTAATITKKFTREDGKIDWSQPANTILNRIRALAHEPGTWTIWREKTLNIRGVASKREGIDETPGKIIQSGKEILVACGTSTLILDTIQLESSKSMSAHDFANGHADFIGSVLN